jgi:hypothetical protein
VPLTLALLNLPKGKSLGRSKPATILVLNWAGFYQPVNELDQTANHPALSPVLTILSGKKKRQIILADLAPPPGKSAENTRQKSWPAVV